MNTVGMKLSMSLALALLLCSTTVAFADSKSVNFESFTLGSVNGQDGWSMTGPYDVAVAPSLGTTGFGTKSLRMSNAQTSGSFGDWVFSTSLTDEVGETAAQNGGLSGGVRQNKFVASWDFASADPLVEQTDLQVSASPDRGDGARMSFVRMNDDATGLSVEFSEYTGGAFVTQTIASGLSRTIPHNIRIEMEFIDGAGNDVVKVFVDNVLKYTGTSWEGYFNVVEVAPTRTVDSLLLQARTSAGTAPATLGKGFLIDNVILTSSMIPTDTDNDGVFGEADLCPATVADIFPQYGNKQAKNRWKLNSSDVWVTNAKPGTMGGFAPTIADTYGCSGTQILDAMRIATGLDFGGEYKFGITKGTIEAWIAGKYHVGPTLVETLEVKADDVDGMQSTSPLSTDVDYVLKARGTANAGDGIDFDADYSFRAISSTEWTDAVSNYESYGPTLLDLMVNGGFVAWGDGLFHTDHVYTYEMSGTGAPVSVGIYDVYFPNNTGSLFVDIIEDKWIDLW